jgi:16S rRNA (uracil1498-N3)-methyltransferase
VRAQFQENLEIQESYNLRGEEAHHLISVARVELGEEILLLNGKGLWIKTKVSSVSKRELTLMKLESELVSSKIMMDLALGIPKKEALELSLKEAVEIGFRRIFLIRSRYSQTKVPEPERLKSLLISALEQSNSPYLPELIALNWDEIEYENYEESLMLDSQSLPVKVGPQKMSSKRLLVVGPEGGFSPEELAYLHQRPGMRVVRLPTPILRTPTAVAVGAGLILGSLLD